MLWTAFILGLGGSLHCATMCGPLVLAMGQSKRIWHARILQNIGRTLSYSMLGWLIGFLGLGLRLAGWQNYLSIIAGVSLLLVLFVTSRKFRFKTWSFPSRLKLYFGRLLPKKTLASQFMLGVVHGFLPCGMVYFALVAALAQPTLGGAALYMALFGLGTIPMLLVIGLSGSWIITRIKSNRWFKVNYLTIFIALFFILRGLGLGIPVISPKFAGSNCEHHIEACKNQQKIATCRSLD